MCGDFRPTARLPCRTCHICVYVPLGYSPARLADHHCEMDFLKASCRRTSRWCRTTQQVHWIGLDASRCTVELFTCRPSRTTTKGQRH
ncbi:hypothetical protein BDZ89DRAFT_1165510 [Hymenopellis radicata]|nr:hypothetical protein BDZ89DRAFT_1165510 [Hymenopellis radicata]